MTAPPLTDELLSSSEVKSLTGSANLDEPDRIIWCTASDARMASPEPKQARDDALKQIP